MTLASPSGERPGTLTVSTEDELTAREFGRKLDQIPELNKASVQIRIQPENRSEETIPIPPPALQLLRYIVGQMALGNSLSLIPIQAELTTTEAAKVLKVSRPFLIGLLEKGEIPFRKTGTHRRIRLRDLMAYKHKNDESRLEALEELSALDQEYELR